MAGWIQLGLLIVILSNGLGIFWPARIEQLTLKDGSVIAGEPVQRQAIPNPGQPDHLEKHRVQLKVGNRDLYGVDFRWVNESEIARQEQPPGLYLVERSEYGPLVGTPVKVVEGGQETASGTEAARARLPEIVAKAERDRGVVKAIEKDEIGAVNYQLERIRLERRSLDYRQRQDPARDLGAEAQALDRREEAQKARYAELEEKLARLRSVLDRAQLQLEELLHHVQLAEAPIHGARCLEALCERRIELVRVLEVLQRFDTGKELLFEDLSEPQMEARLRFIGIGRLDAFFELLNEPLPVANVFELLQTFLQVHGFPRLSPNRKCRVRDQRYQAFSARGV